LLKLIARIAPMQAANRHAVAGVHAGPSVDHCGTIWIVQFPSAFTWNLW
jgi:hypothetical protein